MKSKRISYLAAGRETVLASAMAMLFCFPAISSTAFAASDPALSQSYRETGPLNAPLVLSQGLDQSALDRRLRAAKKDLVTFLNFAEDFRKAGNSAALVQLQTPVDGYLKKHVDGLLAQGTEQSHFETAQVTAEILFIKTRLLLCLDRRAEALISFADLKKRFATYQKITVEIPGKITTIEDALRILGEDLTKTATADLK